MQAMTARPAAQEDKPDFVEWLHANRESNHYDPEVMSYDSTRVLAVDKGDEPVMFLPYYLCLMHDALAPKPGLSERETALALRAAIHEVVRIAKRSKIGEVYFLGSDDATVEFAKAHGYEEMTHVRLMRLKPRNMVPPLPEDLKEQL